MKHPPTSTWLSGKNGASDSKTKRNYSLFMDIFALARFHY